MMGVDGIVKLFNNNNILLSLPLLLCSALFQAVVVLQLTWRSIGIVLPVKRTIIPSMITLAFTWASRMIVTVPFHMFVSTLLIILMIMIYNKLDVLRATIGVLFTHTVIIIGSIILIEPLLLITPDDKTPFFFESLFGFSIGIILETLFPFLVLVFFIHKRIVLLQASQRD